MTTYKDVWNGMNELDLMTSKIGYVKEMIDFALEAIDQRDYQKAESMMQITSEYTKYYLDEYDRNFQIAWGATINAGKELDDVRAKLSRLENPENPQYTDEELEAMCNEAEIDQ